MSQPFDVSVFSDRPYSPVVPPTPDPEWEAYSSDDLHTVSVGSLQATISRVVVDREQLWKFRVRTTDTNELVICSQSWGIRCRSLGGAKKLCAILMHYCSMKQDVQAHHQPVPASPSAGLPPTAEPPTTVAHTPLWTPRSTYFEAFLRVELSLHSFPYKVQEVCKRVAIEEAFAVQWTDATTYSESGETPGAFITIRSRPGRPVDEAKVKRVAFLVANAILVVDAKAIISIAMSDGVYEPGR